MKVTTLRNIALTPPYMHDGRFQTLEEVIEHYNEGLHASPSLDPALAMTIDTGLLLNDTDKVALIAFLKTLTDTSLIRDSRYASPF
jgi:cytochrome c peroxidase